MPGRHVKEKDYNDFVKQNVFFFFPNMTSDKSYCFLKHNFLLQKRCKVEERTWA